MNFGKKYEFYLVNPKKTRTFAPAKQNGARSSVG